MPKWLRLLREDDITGFQKWIEGGGELSESFTHPELPIPWSVLDYLTREASAELIGTLIERGYVKPDQLLASWRGHFRNHVDRFETLMPHLPKSQWPYVLTSTHVWKHETLLEKLAAANVDVDIPINEEGATPLHHEVQAGNKEAIKWLMAHGAVPSKPDKFDRDAFLWAEHGSDPRCLKILQGKDEDTELIGQASPDAPGIALLAEAAANLEQGYSLQISIQIKSPPVTRVEKAYYPSECHYILAIEICGEKVTFKDMHTPRQSYLFADGWPSYLFTPILHWPELKPIWETLSVEEINWAKAMKSRKYQPTLRPELHEAALSTLEQVFDPREAEVRKIEMRT